MLLRAVRARARGCGVLVCAASGTTGHDRHGLVLNWLVPAVHVLPRAVAAAFLALLALEDWCWACLVLVVLTLVVCDVV